jgi:hypothetical protein
LAQSLHRDAINVADTNRFVKALPHDPVIAMKCSTATVAASPTNIPENIVMILKRIALSLLAGVAFGATAQAADVDHVLLISVDGLHALDVANYVEAHPNSAMAELSSHGITYSNARTPANSDSFPGLLALVTGGSPISHGLFYDVSYDRTLFDPSNVTCKGPAGNMMVFDESIDQYNGNVSQNVIDPTKLPRGRNEFGQCVAVFPHNAIRTNTVFEVVKSKAAAPHGRTSTRLTISSMARRAKVWMISTHRKSPT